MKDDVWVCARYFDLWKAYSLGIKPALWMLLERHAWSE